MDDFVRFVWNPAKAQANCDRHGVDFEEAKLAFSDPQALVIFDETHSDKLELRWWLLGEVNSRIMLVRYTHRPDAVIRIFGAGYWRQGKQIYENYWKKNQPASL